MAKDKFEFLTKEDFHEEKKLALLKFTAETFADFVLLLEYPKYKKTIIEILSTNQDLKVSDLQKQLLLLAHNNQLKEALLLRENPLTKNQAPGEELDIILAQLISQQLDLVKSMVALIEEKSWDAILQLENLTILEGFKFPSTYISDGFDSKTSTTMFILKAIENQAPLNVIIKFLEAGILYPNMSEAHENHEILEEHKAILEELENPSLDADNCKAVFDFIDKYKYEETVINFTKHVSTSVAKLPADEREKFLHDILTHVDFETYLKIYLAQYRYCANRAYGRNEKLTDDQKTVIKAIVDCNFIFIENWKTQDNQVLSKDVKSAVISLMDARKRLLDAFSAPLKEAVTQGKFKDTGPDFNLYGVIGAEDKIKYPLFPVSIALIARFTNPSCEEIDALSIINAPNISNMHIKLADIYIKYQSSSKLFADNLYLLLKKIFKTNYTKADHEQILPKAKEIFKILFTKKKDASQDNLWNKIESLIKDLNIHKKKHGEIFFNFVIPNLSDDELTAMQKDNDAILQYVKGIDSNPLSTLTFEHLQTLHSKLFKEQNFISFFKEHFANKYPQYWKKIENFRDSPEYLEWLLNNSNYDKQIFKKIYPYQNYYPFHILSDLSKVRAKNSREKFNLLHCLAIYLEWHHEEGVAYREEYPKKIISDKTIVSLLREIQLNSFKKETFQSFFKEHFADKYPQYWRKIKGFRDSPEYLEWLLNNSNYDKQIFKKIYPYQNYYPLFILSDLTKVRAKNTNKQFKLLNCFAIYLEWYHEEGVACRENHQKKIMSDKTIVRLLYVIRFNSFKEETFQSFFKEHFADKYPQYWKKIENFRDSPEYLEWLVKYLNNPEHDRSIFEKIYRGDYENQMKIDEEKARKHITPNENLCTNLLFNSFFPFSFTTGINYLMQVLSVRSDIRYMTTAASLLYSTQFSKLLRYGNHHYFTSLQQYFLFRSSLIASIGYPLLEYLLLPPPLRTINITENIHLSLAASAIGFLNYTSQSCITGNDIIDNALHFIDQTFDAVLPEWIR
jgi:hypothetical protein